MLGPFPCGAAKCSCTKGGCDRLGACDAAEVAALAMLDPKACGCGHIRLDHQDMTVPAEKLGRCWGAGRCDCRQFAEART